MAILPKRLNQAILRIRRAKEPFVDSLSRGVAHGSFRPIDRMGRKTIDPISPINPINPIDAIELPQSTSRTFDAGQKTTHECYRVQEVGQ
jgi:hypothetical protein